MHASASGGPDARALIAAAVAAGVPSGLLFAVAGWLAALPPLLQAEGFEHGGALAIAGPGRLLWGVAGSVGLGTALALVLTPMVRSAGAPAWRTGLGVGALAFVAVFLLPMLVTRPGPPGVEHAGPLALRQGMWLATVVLFVCAWGVGRLLYGRLRPGLAALAGSAVAGAALWALGLGLLRYLTGFAAVPEAGAVPAAIESRFAVAMVVSNGCLFAALGLFIPPALRRFCP